MTDDSINILELLLLLSFIVLYMLVFDNFVDYVLCCMIMFTPREITYGLSVISLKLNMVLSSCLIFNIATE